MTEMWPYTVCAGLWIGILIGWLIPMIRQKIVYEVYAAFAVGIMISLFILSWAMWEKGDVFLFVYAGYGLYVPAFALAVTSVAALKRRGKPTSGWEHTTVLIKGNVFRLVRHPLYLGGALLSLAILLVTQSITSIVSGLIGIFCYWMASKEEDKFNIEKFGNSYGEYMKKVPMWNVFKALGK
jgi:protein-S-isoprenylcysteine O-methyltransferase Ste14